MFKIQNLVQKYQNKTVLEIPLFEARQGEQWLLLGKSGSGKTTLLHILGALLKPSQGEISVAAKDIRTLEGSKLDKFRAKEIGLIFQKPHLIQTLSVMQNLLLAQYMANVRQDRKLCEQILESLNIADKKKSYPHQLSQGEAQRVSVARAILNHPSLILADEPTASLDDGNATQVVELLKTQALNFNATLLIATHDFRVKKKIGLSYEL